MIKKYVTNSAKKALPDQLIEYLFDVAAQMEDAELQTFRLVPYISNGCPAQLINHTVYRSEYSQMYLVEVQAPLDAVVNIYCDETSYNMSLSDIHMPLDEYAELELRREPCYQAGVM